MDEDTQKDCENEIQKLTDKYVKKIDDVDTIALHEDVRSHSWIPLTTEVAKVTSCLQ